MPLRFPRPVAPVIAAGMTAIWVVAASAPALADQTRQQEWWLSKLNVTQAWRASRGAGVTVAVLSDGIDAAQADVAGSVTVGPDFTNTNETASTYIGLQGTAIASLIAGHGTAPGGRSGIIGVAPRARILSVRVTLDVRDPALDSTTTGAGLPDAIAAGIRYAVAHHARVIDLPLDPSQPDPAQVAALPIPIGSNATTPPQLAGINAAAGGSAAEAAAVAFALRRHVVLVAPAGDNASGTDAPNFPAAYRGVISVGAFGPNYERAPFSSRQPYVTLTAPGADVLAADAAGGYAPISSTTAASAMVSGIAAVMMSRFPGLSPARVARAMTTSTVFRSVRGMKDGGGFGTVNAERAVAAAAAMAAPPSQRSGSGALSLTKPASPPAPTAQSDAMKPRLLRAGLYGGGVLVLLLVLIAVYAVLRRRREPAQAEQVADWNPNPQPAYSPYGSGDPERMLEFFAAPAGAAAPAGTAGSGGPLFQSAQFQPAQFQSAQFQPAQFQSGQAASAQVAASGPGDSLAADADGGDGRRVGAWVPLGPGTRGHNKPSNVSGAPPWEPAAKPDSELPWASPATPRRATTRPAAPASHPAPEPGWPTSASASTQAAAPAVPAAGAPARAPEPSAADPGAAGPSAPVSPPASAARTAPVSPAFPAAPSPSGLAWQDLTDTSLKAIREPAGEPPAEAAPPQREAASKPRSPSGTDWERPDADDPAAASPAEPPWETPDSDAYRPPPADPRGQAPGSGPRWRHPEPAEARKPRSSSGSHRRTGGRAPESRGTESRGTESRPGWPADGSESQWQAGTEARWQAGDDSARPAAARPPWAPAQPVAEPADDSGWPSPRADVAPASWPSGGGANWQPAATDAMWQPPAVTAGRDPIGEQADDDPFSWLPADRTETFPVIGDDG